MKEFKRYDAAIPEEGMLAVVVKVDGTIKLFEITPNTSLKEISELYEDWNRVAFFSNKARPEIIDTEEFQEITKEEIKKIESIFKAEFESYPERMERVECGMEIERDTKAIKEFAESRLFKELIDRLD